MDTGSGGFAPNLSAEPSYRYEGEGDKAARPVVLGPPHQRVRPTGAYRGDLGVYGSRGKRLPIGYHARGRRTPCYLDAPNRALRAIQLLDGHLGDGSL